MLRAITFTAALAACLGTARGQDNQAKTESLKKEIAELRAKLEMKEAELAKLNPIKVDAKLTADQLFDAYYYFNTDGADGRYRGKVVMLLGRIDDVIESPNGVVAVYPKLASARDNHRLCLTMKAGHEGAGLRLRPGDAFRLVGEVVGRKDGVLLVGHVTIVP